MTLQLTEVIEGSRLDRLTACSRAMSLRPELTNSACTRTRSRPPSRSSLLTACRWNRLLHSL